MELVEQLRRNLKETLRYIKERVAGTVDIGIILGSGLGGLVDEVENAKSFTYDELPHFPRPTTEGHFGNLVIGMLAGKRVAVMQGRFHYYEGYTSAGISYPVRVLSGLGAKTLIVTCAAGGLNQDFTQGDIMAIKDHINMMPTNPLVGANDDEIGPRFLDMTEAYNSEYLALARRVSETEGIPLKEGVYVGLLGPAYETPAEIKYYSTMADAVGMSTVPEVLTARHAGLDVLGFAVITNVSGGQHKVSHEEVITAAQKSSESLIRLIIKVLEKM
ncbi:MAG: purine-nucleoside phosphorylase [Actinomycetota bacterium]|nr:purine-nucleoside phosphorylase [Actinomycetota bacterium]